MPITVTPGGHGLGYLPDLPDIRDVRFSAPAPRAALPSSVSMRGGMPPTKDQLTIGSCTAFASTAAYIWQMMRQAVLGWQASELAQYYWSRQREGTTRWDAGATLRNAVKVLVKAGAAAEDLWPYDPSKFAVAPAQRVKQAAKTHQALQYESVPVDVYAMKQAIAAMLPVIVGISVYQSFEGDDVARTGVVPLPTLGEPLMGGHALLACGYDDATQTFEVRNSWGDWGDAGYLHIPYAYLGDPRLGGDYWILKTVEAPIP